MNVDGHVDQHEIVLSRPSQQIRVPLEHYPNRLVIDDVLAFVTAGGERALLIDKAWFRNESSWTRVCDRTAVSSPEDT